MSAKTHDPMIQVVIDVETDDVLTYDLYTFTFTRVHDKELPPLVTRPMDADETAWGNTLIAQFGRDTSVDQARVDLVAALPALTDAAAKKDPVATAVLNLARIATSE